VPKKEEMHENDSGHDAQGQTDGGRTIPRRSKEEQLQSLGEAFV